MVHLSSNRRPGIEPDVDYYAIRDRAEAGPISRIRFGPRVVECAEALLELAGNQHQVFASDDLKLRSSATLFAEVSDQESVFEQLLGKYFDGSGDPKTIELLGPGV